MSPATTGGLDLVQWNRDPEAEQKRRHISHHNEMPSFFLSETIKYLYLTFDAENNVLHQDSEREWVFTTEAHPIHHEPVLITPVLSTEDRSLSAQIEKVRSLVRAMISNVSSEESEMVEEVEVKNITKNLTFERWTRSTKKSSHTDSMAIVEGDVMTRKQEEMKKHGLMLGPYFRRNDLTADNRGIFSEGVNFAYHQFDSLGKGRGLGKRCPNFHHPDLIWSHALNGNTRITTLITILRSPTKCSSQKAEETQECYLRWQQSVFSVPTITPAEETLIGTNAVPPTKIPFSNRR